LRIFANLFLVSNKLQVTMDKRKSDITSKQWFVLAALTFMDQAPTLKELSQALDYSHQNIRQLVNKLEEKKYVRIEKDQEDQRAIRIMLTEKVKAWEQSHQEENQEFVDEMFKGISKSDLKIIDQTLEQLKQNLGDLYETI
ncbi:MarR family winged helix-turn-helix transcriptional regulator, partial [Anoxybacillus flavithermus]